MRLTIGNFDEIIDDNSERLNLSCNQITDISPLSNLANLEYLDLSNNQIN